MILPMRITQCDTEVTVNVAINVPVDNKKNAFFGVPFEVVI